MNLKETLEYMTEDAQSSNTQITTKAQANIISKIVFYI